VGTEPIVVVKKRLTSFSIDARRKSGLRAELSLSFMSQGEMAQTSLLYPPRGQKRLEPGNFAVDLQIYPRVKTSRRSIQNPAGGRIFPQARHFLPESIA